MAELVPIDLIGARPYQTVRDLCHRVKENDPDAIREAALLLAEGLPTPCLLIPVPGHEGRAGYTLCLAKMTRDILTAETKECKVVDALTAEPHPSLCELKHAGKDVNDVRIDIDWVSRKEKMLLKLYAETAGLQIVIIDNVVDTGKTARACLGRLRAEGIQASVAAIGDTGLWTLPGDTLNDIDRHHAVFIRDTSYRGRATIINIAGGVGTAYMRVDNDRPDRAVITNLTVHEDYRRTGLAGALLAYAKAEARQFGATTLAIRLRTNSEDWLREWFKRNGFVEERFSTMLKNIQKR